MKRLLIPLMLLAAVSGVVAQSFTPTVVASAGNYVSSGSGSLSYTIGEMAVTTLSSANNFLTQGFQQPNDEHVGVTHIQLPNIEVKLYPNPASETVNLWIKCDNNDCKNIQVTLHDLLGRQLMIPGQMTNNGNEKTFVFNVQTLAASMYFVRIEDETSSLSQIIKFNKTSL